MKLSVEDGRIDERGHTILVSDPNCQGQAFAQTEFFQDMAARIFFDGNGQLYVGSAASPSADRFVESGATGPTGCFHFNERLVSGLIEADEIMVEDLGIPFPLVGPLHVAPSTP